MWVPGSDQRDEQRWLSPFSAKNSLFQVGDLEPALENSHELLRVKNGWDTQLQNLELFSQQLLTRRHISTVTAGKCFFIFLGI